MATLILNYETIDSHSDIEREFNSLDELKAWLDGQDESLIEWIDLYDNNIDDFVVEGWSEIHQYIRENTGAHLEPQPVCK